MLRKPYGLNMQAFINGCLKNSSNRQVLLPMQVPLHTRRSITLMILNIGMQKSRKDGCPDCNDPRISQICTSRFDNDGACLPMLIDLDHVHSLRSISWKKA